ncbi:CBS-domain-containing protein [Cylindrobasidium torrendii FP15055 ss-10]|uniref:CBS-domain-containing protein n=1 Tax=Cylindrobasidium torrendii FP15055 ss-10 TaxID=1314674 RepID=A0A0D7BRM4_9AGAR|nr:CBS-domain-containing protein [Cylindrobasidium torrendii FP15055 ss-10]
MSRPAHPGNSPLKPRTLRKRAASHLPPQSDHLTAVASIRAFLKGRTCYDVFPISFRLIVLDTQLNVKAALQILLSNSVVSAPLWDSESGTFVGMFTVLDIIHLIQHYYNHASYAEAALDVESLRLDRLREIEHGLGVEQPSRLSHKPTNTLYEAALMLVKTHARRLPLLDHDSGTGQELIVSTLTTYRLLKFISINCAKEIQMLTQPLRKLKIGTYVSSSSASEGKPYAPLATAYKHTTVFDVVHLFSSLSISAIPIIDEDGVVVNLYETVDVITLVRLGAYQSLDLTIEEALNQRSTDFPGVVICTASDSLGTLLQLIKKRRVHRLVVVEGEEEERKGGKKGRLLGIITLSDVLAYIVGHQSSAQPSETGHSEDHAHERTSSPAPSTTSVSFQT